MKTPILDKLESRTKYSYLRRWIKQVLDEDPLELSLSNPVHQEILKDFVESEYYVVDRSQEAARFYYCLKSKKDPLVKMVVNQPFNYFQAGTGAVVWMRPSDLDSWVLLDILLKDF